MKKVLFLCILPLFLVGCGTIGGGADYTYSHISENGASCSIEVGSMRSLQGVGITIGNDCTLTANASTAESNGEMIKVLGAAVNKIPSLQQFPLMVP